MRQPFKKYAPAIAGIALDSGSLCAPYPRFWIFMRHGIDRLLWEETVAFAWGLGAAILPGIPMYIFDECTLEVLLHTQRYWAFEYAHLKNHRMVIGGLDVIARMEAVPDIFVKRMSVSSFLLRRAALRESVFIHTRQQLQDAASHMMRLPIS